MVEGIQFAAWFQSPVAGLIFHVALLAKLLLANESTSNRMAEEFDIRRKKKRTAFSIAWFFQMIAVPQRGGRENLMRVVGTRFCS